MYNGRYDYIALSSFYNFIKAFDIVKLGGHVYLKNCKFLSKKYGVILNRHKGYQDELDKEQEFLSRLQNFLRFITQDITETNIAG